MKEFWMKVFLFFVGAILMGMGYYSGYNDGLDDCQKERADSLQIVLNEIPKKYLLIEKMYE